MGQVHGALACRRRQLETLEDGEGTDSVRRHLAVLALSADFAEKPTILAGFRRCFQGFWWDLRWISPCFARVSLEITAPEALKQAELADLMREIEEHRREDEQKEQPMRAWAVLKHSDPMNGLGSRRFIWFSDGFRSFWLDFGLSFHYFGL